MIEFVDLIDSVGDVKKRYKTKQKEIEMNYRSNHKFIHNTKILNSINPISHLLSFFISHTFAYIMNVSSIHKLQKYNNYFSIFCKLLKSGRNLMDPIIFNHVSTLLANHNYLFEKQINKNAHKHKVTKQMISILLTGAFVLAPTNFGTAKTKQ